MATHRCSKNRNVSVVVKLDNIFSLNKVFCYTGQQLISQFENLLL